MRKLAAIAIASVTLLSQAEVVINEIMADNDGKFPNAAGEAMDWIELYNPGEMPADLTGWRITDTVEDPWSKWKEIPEGTTVPAGGYLLLWGHNKDFPTPEDKKGFCGVTNGEVHVKLGLSSKGETITLAASEADYDAKAFADQVTFDAQFADVSCGRDPGDTSKWLFFTNATPGAANGTDGLAKYPPDEEQGGEEPGPGGDEDIDGPREGEFAVVLDVSRPVAGKAMKATVTGGRTGTVSFAWFVREPTGAYGDAVCEGCEYTPTAADYEHWIRVTATDEGGVAASMEFYFSKLPIIYINTDDGEPVTVKTEYKGATIRIQGNDLYDQQYDGKTEIKGRGNSTWQYDKKPYKLKLSKKTDLFGFGKNKHWVLLANYLDQSLMRNKTAYDLSGVLGLVHMSSEWTDVVINGEYVGNYLLCEHIRVGSDRIDVFDWEGASEDRGGVAEDLSWVDPAKDDISGGYVFEMDDYYDEPSKFQTAGGMKVMVNAPEYLCTSAAMMDFVKGYWNRFEAAYTSVDGYDPTGTHYSQLADIDSMVSYWLVQEIFGNVDAQNHSRYAYKDVGAPMYLGPAWDFDISSGGLPPSSHGLGWKLAWQDSFYREWLDDPLFCLLAWEKYWMARGCLDEYFRDGGVADANAAYLAESGVADTERWGANLSAVVIGKASYKWNEALGFEGDFSRFKNYIQERLAWMDKQFASVDRLMLAVRISKSATPYTKDDVTLSISLGNAEDTGKTDAVTDFVLNKGERAPQVALTVKNGAVTKLHAYVNGLKYGIYNVADGKCAFTVSADKMVAERGHRDMVSLIAKDADGKTIARNYLTILNPPIPPAFTIDFDSNGGTPVASVTNDYGAAISAPTPPTRTGYAFAGWYESGAADPFVFSTMPARDVFLTAHWTLDGWEAISGAKVAIETGLIGYKASGLPKGLTYNKTTGKITGTATKSGEFVVAFTKNGETPREKMIAVRAEKVSVGCEGLAAGPLPAGVGTSGGIDIQIDDESGTKSVSVTKLPAGMKYDSKSGKITGAPSRAGDYEAVLTVTTKYGAKETVRIPVSVTAMPETAVGVFNGFVLAGGETLGTFALTTTAAGRLTAKVVTAARTVSFSGTSWDSVEKGVYRATLLTKSGERLTLTLDSTAAWDANQLSGEFRMSAVATYSVSAQRNAFGKAWHFSATGDAEAGWTFSYAEDAKAAALTVTLRADGSTAIAGKLPNGKDAKGKDVAIKVSASGSANVGGLRDGAVLADFAPVLTVGGKKKALAIEVNLWFDRKNDHASGVGEARFAD